jgi:hypothetical protein
LSHSKPTTASAIYPLSEDLPRPASGSNAIDAPSGKVPGGDDGARGWRSLTGGGG